MKRIFKKLIGFTVGMLFLALPQMGESEEKQIFDLGEIVITATKTPHLLSSVPGSVTVISEADIESINPQDAGDLLENIAGIKMERYGGIGQTAGIHMRGLYATEVLVLVDGRPINSPSLGSADLSWIPIDNIEQIEVVRGPNSALFGANAVGGVINIITKRPPEKFSTTLLSSYGSWNTFTEGIETGGRYGDLGFLITGNYKNSNGPRDNSDYESKSLSAKLEYKICDSQIIFSTEYYRDRVGLPGVRPAEDPGNRYQSQLVLGNDDVSSLFDYERKERYSFNGVFERENLKIKGYFSDWNDYNHREWMEYFGPGYEHHYSHDSYDTKMYGIEPQYSLKLFDVNLITTGLS
jgi:outer membrane receptor for ferrienterochelin and colicins